MFDSFETSMDSRLPGFSVHRIFQARIPEWAVVSFSRGYSWPRDETCISCIASRFFTIESPGKLKIYYTISSSSPLIFLFCLLLFWDMDLEGSMLSEISQKKTNTEWFHLFVESRKQNKAHRHKEQMRGWQRTGRLGVWMKWVKRIKWYKLPVIK